MIRVLFFEEMIFEKWGGLSKAKKYLIWFASIITTDTFQNCPNFSEKIGRITGWIIRKTFFFIFPETGFYKLKNMKTLFLLFTL